MTKKKHKQKQKKALPAFQSVTYALRQTRSSDNEDCLQIFPDLIVATGRARAVEYRNVQRKLARFQKQVYLRRRPVFRGLL